ncbi:hypothetical protein ACFYTF_05435 [Nocardia thailandica]|uniref:Peptidase n=1 Tax=Nocardia thailandica TaxID=257275 RepID=A0ABW6PIM8_9NOCA
MTEQPADPPRPPGLRTWFSARRRLEFCLTLASVTLLTGACLALVMMPRNVGALQLAGSDEAEVLGAAVGADDPRLSAVRRDLQPFGPVLVRHAPAGGGQDALLVAHAANSGDLDVLEAELAPSVADVSRVWGTGWNRAPIVVIASSTAEFTALTRAANAVVSPDAAAVTLSGGSGADVQRVVFHPDAGRRMGREGLGTLLRHELTHVATRAQTVDDAPMWMLEGYADFVSQHGRATSFSQVAPTLTTRLRAGTLPTGLVPDAAFGGVEAPLAYETAWSTCAFVADRYGVPALTELYRRVAASPQSPAALDGALGAVLGISTPALLDGWREWLQARSL